MTVDIEAVRDWTGDEPADDVIVTTWARFNDQTHPAERTALAILRRRRTALIDGPDSWGIEGDYREARSKAAGLKGLDGLIGRLERITGDTAGGGLPTLTSAPICAPGSPR